jgi:hypothetical protein
MHFKFNSRYTKIGLLFLNPVNGNYLEVKKLFESELNVKKFKEIGQKLTIFGPKKSLLKWCQKHRKISNI